MTARFLNVLFPAIMGLSFLFLNTSPALAVCPPGMTPARASISLSHAVGRLNRFFNRMQQASSFNYDRMLYLVDELERREKVWSLCTQGKGASGEQALIEDRIAVLKGEIGRARSLPSGESATPREAIAEARKILSRIPVVSSLPRNSPPETPPPPVSSSFLLRPLVLLVVLVLLGVVVLLFFGLRLVGKKRAGLPDASLMERFQNMGSQWRNAIRARSEILTVMQNYIGQGKNCVRIRAQLYLQDEQTKEWKLSDEVSHDEGGFLRSFGEEEEKIVPKKSFEKVSLGEGETRTRLVVPVGEEGSPSALLVVDALSSPEIIPGTPDPSGLLSADHMKERLFEIAHRSPGPVSVLSFSFDAPEMHGILNRSGEEADALRSFVVRETIRIVGAGTLIFGESPGVFHVILSGKEERRAGPVVSALSAGLGPLGGSSAPETLERPWFQKILIAHTRWRDPTPEGFDRYLDRVAGNMKKLRDNPTIKMVNDA